VTADTLRVIKKFMLVHSAKCGGSGKVIRNENLNAI